MKSDCFLEHNLKDSIVDVWLYEMDWAGYIDFGYHNVRKSLGI